MVNTILSQPLKRMCQVAAKSLLLNRIIILLENEATKKAVKY